MSPAPLLLNRQMTLVDTRQLKSSIRQLIRQLKEGRADISVVVLKTARYQDTQLVVQQTSPQGQTKYFVNWMVTQAMIKGAIWKISRRSQILGIEYPRTTAET